MTPVYYMMMAADSDLESFNALVQRGVERLFEQTGETPDTVRVGPGFTDLPNIVDAGGYTMNVVEAHIPALHIMVGHQ
jgi:hypothetical protein